MPIPPQPMYGANAGTPQQTYESLPPPSVTGRPTGHNPYEFIVNPNTPSGTPHGQSKNFLLKIGLLVGGAVLLMVVAGIILSFVLPKGNVQGLIDIANRQQEIIRISGEASTKATSQDTQNFATNVNLSVTSSQQKILAELARNHKKFKPKELALDHDPKTDTLLANAETANTYDTAVAQTLNNQLSIYETLVQSTYKNTSHAATKQTLQQCFTSAHALVTQAKSLPANN